MDAMHVTARIAAPLLAAVALLAAPVARADDASYLARVNAAPVPIPVADHVKVTSGHYICAELRMYGHTGTYRAGISPGDLVRQLTNTFHYSPEAADVQIQAAQAELCPETLRP
ncbi:DUF732 domain-containing protein [Mycolicibacter arupensis]|jgi:hypothetical protein|uniref:DUF732 domain-containing protein n=1 Tax=Mycolicibacter arupensis TaxID=342002 RepID=A0A0F5MU69_9MYCO|nr:DUF732 domain-containing protein [Mycolicibacter arupensis]KAA1429647.1 DUF732 domain-containing protein [Mycolicibacter arupensis]KKB98226.1 hypothetical protein WR43_15520 [Mycolicibacter arupensis]MCV7274557.1 DUF732 domain-containing protein [Mycolicibacter arupensis]OQZ99296.1 hypothetical protein BST15_07465 [Mycolicibacter arupensis]TXI55362.1 MAG: DUF732 domain-containing protein [Mycolicibacter arupensis]